MVSNSVFGVISISILGNALYDVLKHYVFIPFYKKYIKNF